MDDQRDYAEESAVWAEYEREYSAEANPTRHVDPLTAAKAIADAQRDPEAAIYAAYFEG